MENEKSLEMRVRREAKRRGYRVEKSRTRKLHINDMGLFQLIDANGNTVVDGVDYDLSLKDLSERIKLLPSLL